MAVFIIFGGVLMDELIKKEKISTTVGRKLSICIGKFDTYKSKWLMDRSLKYNI